MRASIALSTPLTRFKFQTKNGVVRGTREAKRNQNSTFEFLSGVYAGVILFSDLLMIKFSFFSTQVAKDDWPLTMTGHPAYQSITPRTQIHKDPQ